MQQTEKVATYKHVMIVYTLPIPSMFEMQDLFSFGLYGDCRKHLTPPTFYISNH